MRTTPETVDDYIAAFPTETRSILQTVRKLIRAVAPEATEGVSYGVAGFKLHGKALIYLGGWEQHIAIYPIPPASDTLQAALAPFVAGKGTLRFKLSEPIPYDLIEQVARAHVARLS